MPETEIYYFTGTGNTLKVAKDIAAKTNAKLIPIASFMDKKTVKPQADRVGIVFPVYYMEPPRIVEQFTKKLQGIEGKYVFVVCTYGGGTGISLRLLKRWIHSSGGTLYAAYGVQMPQNAFHKAWENRRKIFNRWPKKLDLIVKNTGAKAKTWPFNYWLEWLVTPLHLVLMKPLCKRQFKKLSKLPNGKKRDEYFHNADLDFFTNQNCSGCGVCARVCPVDNIEIRAGRPVWLHRCEHCLACYNWCTNKAIQGCITHKNYFYRHPDVEFSEVAAQKIIAN